MLPPVRAEPVARLEQRFFDGVAADLEAPLSRAIDVLSVVRAKNVA